MLNNKPAGTDSVVAIRKISTGARTVCDLTIADNHNLFVRHPSSVDSLSDEPNDDNNNNKLAILAHNCLDENTKFLSSKLGDYGGYALDFIENRHGFTRPADLEISKDDRANMIKFTIPQIAKYGAYDVLTIYALADEHVRIAKERGYKGFAKLVTENIGAMVAVTAFMEAAGVLIDREHLETLVSPFGPFNKEIDEIKKELYERKSVRKANAILLRRRKNVVASEALFADVAEQATFIFDIQDAEAMQTLFFDVLGLEPLRKRKDETGSIDKFFQKKYNKDYREVWLYQRYQGLLKLRNAFAESIMKTLNTSPDARMDGRIRPSFRFVTVVSGRSSCEDPNFQQIPSRSKEAKYIKKLLTSIFGKMLCKSDFSAHEIRVMGNVTNDDVIIKTFETANEALLDLRLAGPNYVEDALKIAKKKGDIHILNVKTLFDQDIDKSHPLRSDVKQTIFSKVYGAMSPKIGRDLQGAEVEKQYDILRDARAKRAILKDELDKLPEHPSPAVLEFQSEVKNYDKERKREELIKIRGVIKQAKEVLAIPVEEYVEKAQDILTKLDDSWDDAAAATKEAQKEGRDNLVVFSPIGRPRHLWAYAYPNKWVGLAMDRRGFNSKIQGLASDIAFQAGYCIMQETYQTFTSRGLLFDGKQVLTVHDSMTNEVSFRFIPVMAYLVEHGMTTLVQNRMQDVFGMEIHVPFGFDLGFGKNEGEITEWDDKRRDSFEKILREQAGKYPEYEDQLDDALHNLDAMWRIRERELREDPYTMLLQGRSKWYAKNIKGMVA